MNQTPLIGLKIQLKSDFDTITFDLIAEAYILPSIYSCSVPERSGQRRQRSSR